MSIIQPEYLGDGLYASFDGYQIWLHANTPDSPQCVAVEPEVFEQLLSYAREIPSYRRAAE